jgi:tetratricopeptide (TPR) repeat protein
MKHRICQFLLCCGLAAVAPMGLAAQSSTNSTGAVQDAVPPASTNPPASVPATNLAPPQAATNLPVSPAITNPPAPPAAANQPAPDAVPAAVHSRPAPVNLDSILAATTREPDADADLKIKLQLAQRERLDKSLTPAAQILEGILKMKAPVELQRQALFELAEVMQDDDQPAKAQQIWSQYLQLYAQDPSVPDVLLRQGLLYRKMGVDEFAISKFYAVMSSALKLKLDNLAYYKKLVLQAQTEIADTYYLDAKFSESAELFNRILKSGEAEANREQLEWKLIRSLSYLTNHLDTITKAQSFLGRFTNSSNVPEVRFLLAHALKNMGRNADAMQQVLLLLQSQQENVSKDPETWAYWQRRAGNEIANQLYKEADYLNALQIYLSLVQLDQSPVWQVPVLYQVGMVYEQLQQWQKATDTYARILDRQKQLGQNNNPTLALLLEMAQWRKDYIAWMQKARMDSLALRPQPPDGAPASAMP